LSCDGTTILLAHPIELHPDQAVPIGRTRSVLEAVASLLKRRQEILMIRIEAYSSEPVARNATRRRDQILESQRRADAVFRVLWKIGGVSAERMEPVGYGAQPKLPHVKARWPIVLRVVQWARGREPRR
jgi:outer membrane protein OmpA-like peptidoglycan-associated protein